MVFEKLRFSGPCSGTAAGRRALRLPPPSPLLQGAFFLIFEVPAARDFPPLPGLPPGGPVSSLGRCIFFQEPLDSATGGLCHWRPGGLWGGAGGVGPENRFSPWLQGLSIGVEIGKGRFKHVVGPAGVEKRRVEGFSLSSCRFFHVF